jgi:hypothetical protein
MTAKSARNKKKRKESKTNLSDLVLPVVGLAGHGALNVSGGESEIDKRLILVELVRAEEVDWRNRRKSARIVEEREKETY